MRTKKAIANQFKANEAFVGSLNALTSTIKKGRYRVLNSSGQYETIHLETSANQVIENSDKKFVSDIEKDKWNNKAERFGNSSQDFSAKTLNISNAILPTRDGIDIGSADKRFRGIYVDEAYLSTNTLYIGDTPILGTHNDTIVIKADPNQSITMQTSNTGTTKVISESGVELSTNGMNANVVVQAKGSNSQVNIASEGSTNINASNVNITGNTTFKNDIKAEKDLVVNGNLTVTGENTTLSTSQLVIKDNIIEINSKQSGHGVTAGTAGIKINRGDSDAFNILFDEQDDLLKVGAESSLKTVALQEWVDSTTAKKDHTHNYLSLNGGNLTGQLTINNHKVYHAGDKPTYNDVGAAPISHTHNSEHVTALTGYTKPSSTSPIEVTDSLNAALGKLEKGLEGKKNASWKPKWSEIDGKPTVFNPDTHTHSSSEVQRMTGYVKQGTTSAITPEDSLNAAISKLEVALDSKEAAHSHPYRPNTWVPSWEEVTHKPTFDKVATSGSYDDLKNKPNIISINDSSNIANNQTWSAKKIYDSLTGKANSSHRHSADQIDGLGSAATLNAGTSANEVLKLDASGKVPVCTLPSIAINETFTAENQEKALKLTVEVGDIVIVTADSKTYICVDSKKTTFDDKFKTLSSGTDSITKAEVQNLLDNKVDKITGKGLSTHDFDATYKTKLDKIENGANKYVHPDNANTRHVTDAQITSWNNKAPGSHTHDNYVVKSSGGNITIHADSDASTTTEYAYIKAGHNKLQVTSSGGGSTVTQGNDKLTFNDHIVYHAGRKPTVDEIGAAAKSHGNHVPTTQTANDRVFLRNDNTWQTLPNATTGQTGIVQLTDSTNSTSTTTAATANSVKAVYDLANSKANGSHSHNNLSSRGAVSMETNTARPAVAGLSMTEAYGNGYPTSYGNVVTMKGAGDGQLLIGWSGTSGAHAPAYIRSKRDMADASWSEWAQIYTTAHKPSLTDLGITTLAKGSYLTGSNYNGTVATTWSVDATTTATADKVVARDSAADVHARLFRSNYNNQNTIAGALAFRVNNSNDDYIRFCSDTAAIRAFLDTYSKSETYTRNEMDSRYRQKTDMVFTDTICITTPAV